MRQRDVAAPDAKYTKELVDAKAENDALRDDVAATSSVAHQSSLSPCVKPPPPPAWIMQPPPDWQTPLNGIISPSERGWSLCKNNWKEPRSILMSSADRAVGTMGNSCNYWWAIHTRFQRSINAQSNKTEQSTNVCWLCLTLSAPHKFCQ